MLSLSSLSLSSLDTPCNSCLVIVYFVLNVKSTDRYQFLFNACWRCVCFKDTFYFQGSRVPLNSWESSYFPVVSEGMREELLPWEGEQPSRPQFWRPKKWKVFRGVGATSSSQGCIPSFHFLAGKCHFFCVFDGCSKLAWRVCSLTEWLFWSHLVWNAETRGSWIYLSTGAFFLSAIHICHFVFRALIDSHPF